MLGDDDRVSQVGQHKSVDLVMRPMADIAFRTASWPALTLLQQMRLAASPGSADVVSVEIRRSVPAEGMFAAQTLSESASAQAPACIMPVQPSRLRTPADLVEYVRDLSAETLVRDIETLDVKKGWQLASKEPRRWLCSYASMIEAAWDAVEVNWRAGNHVLDREVRRIGAAVVTGQADVLLNDLHPRLSYANDRLSFRCDQSSGCENLGDREVLLIPMIAPRTSVMVDFSDSGAALIGYGVGQSFEQARSSHRGRRAEVVTDYLSALIGDLRADILRATFSAVAMTDLSRVVFCARSTATYHCTELVNTGLLRRTRVGSTVYVRRTPRAEYLIDAMSQES